MFLFLPQHDLDRFHGILLQGLHQVETVGYLHNLFRGLADDGSIDLASVTRHSLYFQMRLQPVRYLVSVARIKDCNGTPGIMVCNDAHISVALLLREIVQPYMSAGTHNRIFLSKSAKPACYGRHADPYTVPGQGPGGFAGRLS